MDYLVAVPVWGTATIAYWWGLELIRHNMAPPLKQLAFKSGMWHVGEPVLSLPM